MPKEESPASICFSVRSLPTAPGSRPPCPEEPPASICFSVRSGEEQICGEVFFGSARESAPAIILCHGIPSGVQPQDNCENGYRHLGELFAGQGHLCVIFNFRGTGESSGNLDLVGWVYDLQAVIKYLRCSFQKYFSGIILIGFSAGAAVALEVAAADTGIKSLALAACPADFLFLEQLYTPAEAARWMREIGVIRNMDYPADLTEWWEQITAIRPERKISLLAGRRILIIHGEKDEMIPFAHALRLFHSCKKGARLVSFPLLGHSLRQQQEVIRYMLSWLGEESPNVG